MTRQRLIASVCARLRAIGDPKFVVFGFRTHVLGAHVVAHLEELEADACYVPPEAVADYIREIDEARLTG